MSCCLFSVQKCCDKTSSSPADCSETSAQHRQVIDRHSSQRNSVPPRSGSQQHRPWWSGRGSAAVRLYPHPPHRGLNPALHQTATEHYQWQYCQTHAVPESNGSAVDDWSWRWQRPDTGNHSSSSMLCRQRDDDDDWRCYETVPQTYLQQTSTAAFSDWRPRINGYDSRTPQQQCGAVTEWSGTRGKQHRHYRHAPFHRPHRQRQH